MRHSILGLLLISNAALSPAAAQERAAESLLARALGETPIATDLQELSDTIGGRPTGSPALDRAVEWGAAKFKAAGLDDVRLESYVAPGLWLPGVETGVVTQPRYPLAPENELRVAAMPFSSSTRSSGVEAEVIAVGSGDEAAFAAAGERVRGRWILVHTEPMQSLEDLFREYLDTPPCLARARQHGAAGILWMSTHSRRLLYRHNATLDGSLYTLPGAVVEREGALRTERLLSSGRTVRVKLRLQSTYAKETTMRNVVAEIRGREKPAETVILGAHLDSWDLGRGALDNGCNVALVLDVGRQMMALAREGTRPRRSVRFVLYTGEEAGLFGSWGEVRNHRADLDRVKAQVIFDIGTGHTSGFSLGGREDLRAAADAALAPAVGLGPFTHTADAFVGTDNYDYMLEGVPTLVANQDGTPYLPEYHAESDTYDKADLRQLMANAAIAAVLVWGLAEMAEDPAPRQSRTEIEAMTQATGLREQMQAYGLWDDFVAAKRGRMP